MLMLRASHPSVWVYCTMGQSIWNPLSLPAEEGLGRDARGGSKITIPESESHSMLFVADGVRRNRGNHYTSQYLVASCTYLPTVAVIIPSGAIRDKSERLAVHILATPEYGRLRPREFWRLAYHQVCKNASKTTRNRYCITSRY
jgi:hypothetical protein